MDVQKFTDSKTGRLVQFSHPDRESKLDWAFVPNPMPVSWDWKDLWPLLSEAKVALATLNGSGLILPNPQLLLMPLQRGEAISSSAIEGMHVTPEQLLLFEIDPRDVQNPSEKAADWEEVFSYSEALRYGFTMLQTQPISHVVIRGMHSFLMRGVRGADAMPGAYRTVPVQIGDGLRFIAPPPSEVQPLMDNFEQYARNESEDVDPLIKAYMLHYQFEAIHPFKDGNGRIGRALLALMIQKWLGHKMPWLYMSPYFNYFEKEYIDLLFRISTHGEWREWIEFCLRGTICQAKESALRCQIFIELKQRFLDQPGLTAKCQKIIELLFSTPVVSVLHLTRKLGMAYPTAKRHAERMMKTGILKELPNIYPRTFFSPQIMAAAFSDISNPTVLEIIFGVSSVPGQPSEQSGIAVALKD